MSPEGKNEVGRSPVSRHIMKNYYIILTDRLRKRVALAPSGGGGGLISASEEEEERRRKEKREEERKENRRKRTQIRTSKR